MTLSISNVHVYIRWLCCMCSRNHDVNGQRDVTVTLDLFCAGCLAISNRRWYIILGPDPNMPYGLHHLHAHVSHPIPNPSTLGVQNAIPKNCMRRNWTYNGVARIIGCCSLARWFATRRFFNLANAQSRCHDSITLARRRTMTDS